MKKILLLILFGIFFFGCKPYQTDKIRKGQITYEKFRSEQKFYRSADGVIKYIDKGTGPAIVLLHGVPTSGWLYRKMMYPLIAGGYRVIIPDMLGFGSSDSPEGYEIYSENNHAKRLLALMEHLKIEKWHQVIHDAGGLWTWELMKESPEKIEKLVVLNTILFEEGFYPPVRFEPGAIAKTAMWSYRNGVSTNILLKKLFDTGLKENKLNELDIEGYRKPLLEGKTNAMYYFFTQTCNALPDYAPVFENVKIPVAIIWGIHDTMLQWTPQQTKATKSLKVKEEYLHLIDEKHFIQETEARNVSYKILDFLERS